MPPVPGLEPRSPADHAQLYQILISELIHVAVFLTDSEGYITSWNPGVERILGYQQTEFIGQPISVIFTPEDQEAGKPVEEMTVAAREGRSPDIRWHLRKDGTRLFVEGTLIALRDSAGALLGFSKVMADVTERKRAQDQLHESEDHFRNSIELSPQIPWTASPAGATLDLSQKWLDLTGVAREQDLSSAWTRVIHPNDIAFSLERWLHSLYTGEPYDVEHRVKLRDGSYWWMRTRAFARKAADGTVIRWYGTTENIDAQKQAEFALAERARLNVLGADIGVALTRAATLHDTLQQCAQTIVQHLDAAVVRIWTIVTSEDVLELQASAGLYTDLDGPYTRIPMGSQKIGRIAQDRTPHITNDVAHDALISNQNWVKREGIVSFAGYPLVVEDRVVGVLGLFAAHRLEPYALKALASVSDNIAIGIERKRAEEALAGQALDLARSNADLQQFAYVTSHDLQEPLRSLISFSQLLLRRYGGQLDKDADEFLNYIVSGALRMKSLVDSLLRYSRVVNVETMPFTPIPLESTLHWATMNLQTIIAENHARVTHDALPTVLADQVQIVQLLQNLIHNAIKYRKKDEALNVHVTAEHHQNEWWIAVRDNGIGIEPEHLQRIFGVFKRLHGKEIPGTGIGLAIAKRIVENHGGRLWVDSTPGVGSTFYFALPA